MRAPHPPADAGPSLSLLYPHPFLPRERGRVREGAGRWLGREVVRAPSARGNPGAIVVLGCPASPALMRRVECGIRLYREGAAPLLLLSGGGSGPISEAEIMRQIALSRGVPERALLVETRSDNTIENAREAARLLRPHGVEEVLLVSDRSHLPRAALLFHLAGLRVAGWAGVRPRSMLWEAGAAFRECLAFPGSLARALRHARRAAPS